MKTNLFALLLLASAFLYAQDMDYRKEQKRMVKTFVSNYGDYNMDIKAAGLATIEDAQLMMEGELHIAYAYRSGNENRYGRMNLSLTDGSKLKGNWKTDADNGNNYQGSLYLTFKKNGEAFGHYSYDRTEYKITILKVK